MMPPLPYGFMTAASKKVAPIVHSVQYPSSGGLRGPLRKRKIAGAIPDLIFNPTTPSCPAKEGGGGADVFANALLQALDVDPIQIQRFDLNNMVSEKATAARDARRKRRFKRAKSQAIHLVGGGDVTDIKEHAVLDSDYSRMSLQESNLAHLEEALLSDFNENFDPKAYVETAWDQVYDTLMETIKAEEAAAIMRGYEVDLLFQPDDSPSSGCSSPVPISVVSNPDAIPVAAAAADDDDAVSVSTQIQADDATVPEDAPAAAAVVTPPKEKKEKNGNLKTLPSGKDPESRRLRRLMRNRLSAQASRDRRKKAIDDLKAQKAEKEEEIALLEKAVSEVRLFYSITFVIKFFDSKI